jgi:hypothetical protein
MGSPGDVWMDRHGEDEFVLVLIEVVEMILIILVNKTSLHKLKIE